MRSVYIIIVNWNGLKDTYECIRSVLNISYKNYTILVVDNGSDKDDSKEIATKFPEVITLRSESNLGFSGGNNLGIKYAMDKGAEYILLLNNDTIVEKDFLDVLVNIASKNQTIGLAVPKINYYSEPSKVWYAGGYISKFRGAALTEGCGKSD
jgi:GT2 family glycosyltransferase